MAEGEISRINILGRMPPEAKALCASVAVGEIALWALVDTTYKTATCWQDHANAMFIANTMTCGLPIVLPLVCYGLVKGARKELENRKTIRATIAKNMADKRSREAERGERDRKERGRIRKLIVDYCASNYLISIQNKLP